MKKYYKVVTSDLRSSTVPAWMKLDYGVRVVTRPDTPRAKLFAYSSLSRARRYAESCPYEDYRIFECECENPRRGRRVCVFSDPIEATEMALKRRRDAFYHLDDRNVVLADAITLTKEVK